MVSAAFHGLANAYGNTSSYMDDILISKFVLCPSGLSMDSYRIWEVLLLGSVPVVESNAGGLDRAYSSLPVMVVRNFSVLTPALLTGAYPCFVRHARQFKFEHLTEEYWVRAVQLAVRLCDARDG